MFKASLKLPATFYDLQISLLGQSFDDLASAYSSLKDNNGDQSPWVLEWLFDNEPDHAALSARLAITAEIHSIALPDTLAFEISKLQDRDWLSYSYKPYPAFSIGPFFIYGADHKGIVPEGQIGLQIDADTAFGSGDHSTTKGCLQAMLDLKGQGACPWNVLDMGTGSGILAIAAWKLWKTPILAVDNDPKSVRVSERHRSLNNVPDNKTDMICRCGDGFNEETVQRRKPFDLIIANILAGPLKEMAGALVDAADDNGAIILSGILNEQAQSILDVYLPLGLEHRKTIQNNGWSTLILRKP